MRSKDRLAELQRAAASSSSSSSTEIDGLAPPPRRPDIEDVFREVERVREWIHDLDGDAQLVRRLHADPTFHTNKHLQEQLDAAVERSARAGLRAGAALRELEARAREAAGRNDASARILRLQYACLRRLYADALTRHHAALQALRDARLKLLHEQIKLTNLTITDEECQSLLDSRNISLFVDNVGAQTAQARLALRDVEARHSELTRLEGSLLQVRDLFTQLAYLVAAQGERVDSVEYYALQASEHVETGQNQLLKGTVSRTKARKNKMSLIICLSAGFLVVLLVLVFT